MNAIAIFTVNEHMQYLLDESAKRRAAHTAKPGIIERIGSTAASLRTALTRPVDYSNSILPPRLDEYPYRG